MEEHGDFFLRYKKENNKNQKHFGIVFQVGGVVDRNRLNRV